jgi:D-lactate dehydrogenase
MLSEDSKLQKDFIALLSRRLRKEMGTLRGLGVFIEESTKEESKESKRFKVACFDRKGYFQAAFGAVMEKEGQGSWLDLVWFDGLLNPQTAQLATGCQAVCCFVNDNISAPVVARLGELGIGLIAMRCAGYDNVDLGTAVALNVSVTRVPAYSPAAVAEHAIALLLTLNRKTHKAYERVHAFNFSLEGLVGFDIRGKCAGIFGTGRIGVFTAQILIGFGCRVIACDLYENAELKAQGVRYVSKEEMLRDADILSLHAPLTNGTKHWLDAAALKSMKKNAVVINTSRGPLVDTEALLAALMEGRIAGAGLDVLEGEGAFFFRDQSDSVSVANTTIARLVALPNVIITGHQAFLTREALENIAQSTLTSITQYAREGKRGEALTNFVKPQY